jgi:16S rRNA (uracil1498-N3)-methyltransferase
MHYFYCEIEINGNSAAITDIEQIHHLRNVLRLKTGQQITVCDNAGSEYLCTIASLDRKEAVLVIENRTTPPPGKNRLALACALPRLTGMDDIIDKLTQLDVDVIIPLQTERTVVRLDQAGPRERMDTRLERWRKIGRNAAEQSHRISLPKITPLMGFSEVLEFSKSYGLRLIPTLAAERKSLKEVAGRTTAPGAIALIGPEGDFTPAEVEGAIKAGFIAVSLGETVLRVETAAIAVASFLRLNR